MQMHPLDGVTFLNTPAERAIATAAWKALLAAGERAYVPCAKPVKPTFDKHGDPGAQSNRNTVGNALVASELMGDANALEQSALTAERLIETWDTLDRAHSHRYAWLGPLYVALREKADPRADKILLHFHKALSWMHGDKYVGGNFVGATMRPLRILFEAFTTGAFAVKMAAAGLPADAKGGAELCGKARAAIEKWCLRVIGGDIHWGWFNKAGEYVPTWSIFPYADSLDPKTMATHTTAFHPLHVMAYSFFVAEAAGLDVNKLEATRRGELCSHALRLCFDPKTGLNTKSIGYKADHTASKREAYYAPGYATKPMREQSTTWKMENCEAGYHDVAPALIAVLRSGEIDEAEAKRVLVKWVKESRGIVPGEVLLGSLALAIKLGFGAS